MAEKQTQKPYLRQVFEYYLSPTTRSFFTILYLLFFVYFVIFYFDQVVLASRFVWYTVKLSTFELSLSHVFWGSLFVITLIIPFSASLYALLIPFEMRKKAWEKIKKIVLICLVAIITLDIIVIMDAATRYLKEKMPIQTFLIRENIYLN